MGKKMFTPLLVDAGLDLSDIGSTIGLLGFGAGLVGAFAGGALVNPLGRLPALLLTGLLQSLAIAAWALAPGQTEVGGILLALIAAEHLCGGMATSALFTLMMDACGEENAGTDYTLQASVVVFSTGLAAALAGQVAERWDYGPHFLISGLLSALALLPALWAWRRGGFELLRR
jgi:predicted MFS family arabinose efflux permease